MSDVFETTEPAPPCEACGVTTRWAGATAVEGQLLGGLTFTSRIGSCVHFQGKGGTPLTRELAAQGKEFRRRHLAKWQEFREGVRGIDITADIPDDALRDWDEREAS